VTERLRGLVPMARVADVQRSIEFYEQLGFEVQNTVEDDGVLNWAYLARNGAHLMVTLGHGLPASGPIQLYLYVDDVRAYHDELAAKGIDVGPVEERFYMPNGEFELADPDGHCLLVGHL
jgi:catechol 2,3-dioxygenase-like lactoylglutathione lyase family enzyme